MTEARQLCLRPPGFWWVGAAITLIAPRRAAEAMADTNLTLSLDLRWSGTFAMEVFCVDLVLERDNQFLRRRASN